MASATEPDAPLRVLYIAGLGRSGSTLVGTVLGAAAGLYYAGEMRQFWQRNLVENRLCGCGVAFQSCPAWAQILARVGTVLPEPKAMVRAQKLLRALDDPARLRRVRQLTELGDLSAYSAAVRTLYRTMLEVSGAAFVVDSSKGSDYLRALTLLEGVEVHILHLVRDPCATAHSWARKRKHPDPGQELYMRRFQPWQTARRWVRRNRAVETVAGVSGRPYLLLRYEDFAAQPPRVTEQVLRWLGRPPDSGPRFTAGGQVELPENHGVWGNPSRFAHGAVAIRADDEWRAAMPPLQRLLVTMLTAPWRRRWGYGG